MSMNPAPNRVLALACDDFACGHWRLIEPYGAIKDPRLISQWSLTTPATTGVLDIAVVQRLHCPEHVEFLKKLKLARKKIVIDYDDTFPITDPRLPDYGICSPGSTNALAVRQAIDLADAITVPTPELAEYYGKMHRRVVLLPNSVDLTWPIFSQRLERVSEKVTIFWSGWNSHVPNLQIVKPVLRRLLRERDDIVLAVCGTPEVMGVFTGEGFGGRVAQINPVPFAVAMALASIADIVIAPLELTEFNEAKSEIRLIEAGAWSVPALASPVAAYRRFEGGQGACLLTEGNDLESWHAQLARLVADADLRRAIGRKARATVESKYDLREVNRERVKLLCDL